MCRFVSFITLADDTVLFITADELNTAKGRRLLKDTGWVGDAVGHGFLRQYFARKVESPKSEGAHEYEIKNFYAYASDGLPKPIVRAIKQGKFGHMAFYDEEDNFLEVLTNEAKKRYDKKRKAQKNTEAIMPLLMKYIKVRKNRVPAWR